MADNRLKNTDVITSGAEALFELYGYTNAAAISGVVGNISRGTSSSKTIVQSGDAFRITATGWDGAAQQKMAEISMAVGGTPGSGDMPGSIVFKVTPDGSATLATALTIAQDKSVTLAGASLVGPSGTFSLLNSNVTTLNIGGAATTITIGATGANTVTIQPRTFTVGTGAAGPSMIINGAAGSLRAFRVQSNGSLRWAFGGGQTAESGSDAGSEWQINAYTDAGSFIDTPINIARVSGGAITFSRPITASGDIAVNGGDLTSTATTFNLLNSTVTTLNIGGAATAISFGNASGTVTIPGNLVANGAATVLGDASTDLITLNGRLLVRSVTDSGPMTATAGTQREIVFNTSDSKYYGCTVSGTPATWSALN